MAWGRGVGPGWDQLAQDTTSFAVHLGEKPVHSYKGSYMVNPVL